MSVRHRHEPMRNASALIIVLVMVALVLGGCVVLGLSAVVNIVKTLWILEGHRLT